MPPVGALVNNAGITSPTRFLEVTGEEWDRIFAVNVRGSYNITRRVAPAWWSAVSVASSSCPQSQPSEAAAYSVPWRTRRPRPRSSASHERWPESWGRTGDSQLRRTRLHRNRHHGGALTGERRAQLVAQIPVGRGGNVHDVADLITFLCREESGYITGVTYDVNGGAHIH